MAMASPLSSSPFASRFAPSWTGSPVDLDLPSLNVFFRIGFFIGSDSAFKGMQVSGCDLPPVRETTLPHSGAIDAYIDLFRQAIRRCITAAGSRPVCMGISGGRDSRHILLELRRQNAPPDLCWTINSPASTEELKIATELCRQLGVPHVVVTRSESLQDEMLKDELTNYSSLQHRWIMGCRDATRTCDVAYDGIGGDVLSAGLFLSPAAVALVEQGRIEEYVESIVHDVPCLDSRVFSRRDAVERVYAEFSRYLGRPDPISAFWFANRTRRDIATSAFHIVGHGKQVMTPYLDNDVAAFLLSLPMRMTVDHQLHTDTICRAYPECKLPYASKRPLPSAYVRRSAMRGLCFAATHSIAPLSRNGVIARLLRTALWPRRNDSHLSQLSVYCHQITAVVRGDRPIRPRSSGSFRASTDV